MMHNRIEVLAEITACECIRTFDETKLDLELRKAGLDPDGLPLRLEARLETKLQIVPATDRTAGETQEAGGGTALGAGRSIAAGTQPVLAPAGIAVVAQPHDTLELAGTLKFFDPGKGYGFITADDEQGDIMLHISCLEASGYRTAYEGARIHASVRRTAKGWQATSIISMDESCAVHPSQLPQRTHQKVQAQSDWVVATVKWYDRIKGFGFVNEGPEGPDCFVHADTLRRWGLAALHPGQMVEVRWGMSPRGRMVADIRHAEAPPPLPPVH
jgi:CspA family cold shock protein